MGSLSAAASLHLPVQLHGIQLGRPTDLLVDVESWHVLGFVVRCGDESVRFLPLAASQPSRDGDRGRLGADAARGRRVLRAAERLVSLARSAAQLPLGGVLRDVLIGERRRRSARARDRARRRRRGESRLQAREFVPTTGDGRSSYPGRPDGEFTVARRAHARSAHAGELGAARQVLRRRRGRLRRQPRRLLGRCCTRASLPARGDVLVPRRGDVQLRAQPALDLPRPSRRRRRAGDAVLRRLARARSARTCSCCTSSSQPGRTSRRQAIAIVLVTPLNFVGNKLWSFRRPLRRRSAASPSSSICALAVVPAAHAATTTVTAPVYDSDGPSHPDAVRAAAGHGAPDEGARARARREGPEGRATGSPATRTGKGLQTRRPTTRRRRAGR